MPLAEIAGVALLASVHLFVHRVRWLDVLPRSRWLSFAGGVSVAYVFLHVLPELATHEETLARIAGGALPGEQLAYAFALAGLVTFYGLERMVRTLPPEREAGYRLHLSAYALYNGLVGYLVFHREAAGNLSLVLFVAALGLHFVTVDHGLRKDHRQRYDRGGRWLLAGAAALGGLVGLATRVPDWAVSVLFAILAGSVLLNVLKEELPAERQSRFAPFLFGAVVYGALLVALRTSG
jgi:hypothetical protein